MSTKIPWTDEVWNPVSGCTKVSEGCKHCYAAGIAKRFPHVHGGWEPCTYCAGKEWAFAVRGCPECDNDDRGIPIPFSRVICHLDRLDTPLHWTRKPRRVFVPSMGDLGHPDVPTEFVARVWSVMERAYKHTFMVLTKRPERLREFILTHMEWESPERTRGVDAPPNIWLGVTAETQERADERIPILLDTPAAVRFVSVEPMLGPPDPEKWGRWVDVMPEYSRLDWIIMGCESGPRRRPAPWDWFRSLRLRCGQAGRPPVFIKQMGANEDGTGKVVKMPTLDGRVWAQIPESP